MVQEPGRFVDAFLEAGADRLILHHEVLPDPRPSVRSLHDRGKNAGVAIKPDSTVLARVPYVAELLLAPCIAVLPGFSRQKFLPDSPPRIAALRRLIDQRHRGCDLEVDGGIDKGTTPVVVQAGANVLVAATAVFGVAEGPGAAVREL